MFSVRFCQNVEFSTVARSITPNGSGIAEGGEIEALQFSKCTKVDRSTQVQFSTSAPLLAIPCCTT